MTTTKRTNFASVWDAIEDSREIAASLRLRAEVANAIIEETRRRKLTQARAAVICGVTQPRISDLMRGRLDLFSLDALIDMAAQLELRTSVTVRRTFFTCFFLAGVMVLRSFLAAGQSASC